MNRGALAHLLGRGVKHFAPLALLLAIPVSLAFAVGVPALPTYAAGTITVDRTDDTAAASACTGAANDCSLRGAVIFANAPANPGTTISVPAGTYTLSIPGGNEDAAATGDLDVLVSGVTVTGAGSGSTLIQWTAASDSNRDRVFDVNPLVGTSTSPFTFAISGVTIKGGRDNFAVGGGGIFFASKQNVAGGSLTINDVVLSDNKALGGTGCCVGGGLGASGGSLTISNSTFDNNSSIGSGGGVYYDVAATGGTLSISTSTFTNNTSTGGNGGALRCGGATAGAPAPCTIRSSRFAGNKAQASNGMGGAIFNESGTLDIATSSFESNQAPNSGGRGGAIGSADGSGHNVGISFSRFVGNTAASGNTLYGGTSSTMTANDNWWSINTGPATNDRVGTTTVATWLQLRHAASPNTIPVNGTSTLTADIFGRNAGGPVAASNLVGLPAFPVPAATIFGNAQKGTLSGAGTQFVNGQTTATFTATACGAGGADATADSQTVTAAISIQCSDLTAAKSNNVSGSAVAGQSWTWTITVNNGGGASANFSSGQTILTDNLPNSASISYGSPAASLPGVSCSINASKDLRCTASSAVTLALAGSFTVQFTVAASAAGAYANPRAGSSCGVDPGGVVTESNESNNACSDSVTIGMASTTTSITSDTPDPSVIGQAVTVHYSVAVNSPGSGAPTGNVTVSDGTASCSGTVAVGQCAITFTSVGAKSLTATYMGDANFNGSTSAAEVHTVKSSGLRGTAFLPLVLRAK